MLKLLVCAVLTVTVHQAVGTRQCNLYNAGVKGAFLCGLEWWQARDLGRVIDVDDDYKVSKIVEMALSKFNLPLDSINNDLTGNIEANSTNPLAKIIESALTVEPYVTYGVADLLLGFDITDEELQRFGLPAVLASREDLIKMYTQYFDYSCTANGVTPFVQCMKTWMTENCQSEDEPNVIERLLGKIRDTYCDGTSADRNLISQLTKDLGMVFKGIPDFLGVYKDANSPFLFNISADSWIMDGTTAKRLGEDISSNCSYVVNSLGSELFLYVSENSTIGAGIIVEAMFRASDSMARCVLRVVHRIFPTFFANNPLMLDHMNTAAEHYGMAKFSYEKTDVATIERHSVTVFGDPHIQIYKATTTMTCSAFGWKTYLSNEYFTLEGNAEPPIGSSSATYVVAVRLTFINRLKPVLYVSAGTGSKPSTTLTVDGFIEKSTEDIDLVDFGDGVQILDKVSGAMFGFKKYRETYYFTVRMGSNVFDGSLGLLITGCSDPIDISATVAGRKRRDVACGAACTGVDSLYRDTCVFDCSVTNDEEVSQISKGIVILKEKVESEDMKVLESLRIKATTPSSSPAHSANQLLLFIFSVFVINAFVN